MMNSWLSMKIFIHFHCFICMTAKLRGSIYSMYCLENITFRKTKKKANWWLKVDLSWLKVKVQQIILPDLEALYFQRAFQVLTFKRDIVSLNAMDHTGLGVWADAGSSLQLKPFYLFWLQHFLPVSVTTIKGWGFKPPAVLLGEIWQVILKILPLKLFSFAP